MYISLFDVPPVLPSTAEPNPTQHQNDPPPSIMIQANGDILSELLIAQLLEEDLRMLAQAQEAERVQLDHVLTESKLAARLALDPKGKREMSPFVFPPEEEIDSDAQIALQIAVNEARAESDAAYAQSLQSSQNSAIFTDQQTAQKWAAAERKLMLDVEFAKRLQAMQNEGKDIDSDPSARDVETVLGRARVDDILARDPNKEDKGKGKATHHLLDGEGMVEEVEMEIVQSANSSARLPFGLQLPCPNSHPYCLECVGSYIRSKLDPHGDGKGNFGSVVFPINCPECDEGEWVDGIPDDVASRVVDGAMMDLWGDRSPNSITRNSWTVRRDTIAQILIARSLSNYLKTQMCLRQHVRRAMLPYVSLVEYYGMIT
ncbi:hypothetical protein NLI96_g102 [Meripilus lineatus]|uniref:Uncharacterized protein n=1 Tax=Meripilus lineatus TaxID=2056292 RepID=A0AAD5VH16_9APHY|nr:hypothetical protein NLI96_g102 [Physisporinus lineatus]